MQYLEVEQESGQVLCVYPLFGQRRLMVPLLQRVTFEKRESNQSALAPTLGTSLRLGVPVIRQGFGGPPPRALHGAGRLNRHPCRFTPQIPAEFRPACLMGRLRSKSKAKRGGLVADRIVEAYAFPCRAGLPAKVVNDDAGNQDKRGALTGFRAASQPNAGQARSPQ